jgi:L-rhamnose mutarotase
VIRKAFRMSVYRGREYEYERRHNPIWPELADVLLRHGVSTYSIFIDPETLDLFGYAEVESEQLWQDIAHTEVCRKWWRYMEELMPANADASPVAHDLREVFHLERQAAPDQGLG